VPPGRKLAQSGLAENDGAGRAQATYDLGIRCRGVTRSSASVSGCLADEVDVVLDRPRCDLALAEQFAEARNAGERQIIVCGEMRVCVVSEGDRHLILSSVVRRR
jgi:hypothetical protein